MNGNVRRNGCAYRQDILERWLEEVSELLLGDELEEGGFERVTAYIVKELHRRRPAHVNLYITSHVIP